MEIPYEDMTTPQRRSWGALIQKNHRKTRHNPDELRALLWRDMTKAQRIAAVKFGIYSSPDTSNNEHHLRHRYKMLGTDYTQMLEAQDGVCAICRTLTKSGKLYVDHDHKTGEVRGLLCPGCNTLLGMLEKRPTWLQSAWAYLA